MAIVTLAECSSCGDEFTACGPDSAPPPPEILAVQARASGALEDARDVLSTATGGRPDFEGFAASLRSEAAWIVQLYGSKPEELPSAKADAQALEELATEVEKTGKRLGFL